MNMNSTSDYNDLLDSDSLACKPGNTATGLEEVCRSGMSTIGTANLFNGLWCLYLAYNQRHNRKLRTRQIRDSVDVPNHRTLNMQRKQEYTRIFSYMEKILLSLGVATVGYSLQFLVYGFGTTYPTTHIRGQIGDIAAGITFASAWYNSLLGHRGANFFKSSVPQPLGIANHPVLPSKLYTLASVSTVFDKLQSWLSPLIALVLWGMLRAGIYKRGWYLFCLFSLQVLCGVRAFVSIVVQRLSTLKRIARMVTAKAGTKEENDRRNGFLTRKTISILVDLTTVLSMSIVLPASYLIFGSTFNSRQLAIHGAIHGVLYLIVVGTTCLHLNSKFNISRRKLKTEIFSKGSPSFALSRGISLLDGSSIVQHSDV